MGFRIGSIPVRIQFSFFLIAIFVSSSLERPDAIAVGVAVVFVSILLHELGHALMGKVFGLDPEISLGGMGGLTSWSTGRNLSHWKSILVSLAGPFTGFFAYGALILGFSHGLRFPDHPLARLAVVFFMDISLWWGILNLVPLLPLDGGNVMRSFLHIITKGRGEKPARYISIVTGALFIAYAVYKRSLWLGFMGASFTYMNYQALRLLSPSQPMRAPVEVNVEENLRRAYEAVERDDGATAVMLLRPVLEMSLARAKREEVMRLFAYGLLIEGAWRELLLVLEREKSAIGDAELQRYATAARELKRPEEADRIEALRTA